MSHSPARPASRRTALVPKRTRPQSFKALGILAVASLLVAAGALWWLWRQDNRPGAVHFQQGQAALNAGASARAEQEWATGIQTDPQYAPNYVSLGDLYFGEKRYNDAVTQYTSATRLTPDDGLLFLKLDQADLGIGDVTEARVAARRAAHLCPDDADVQGLYGLLEAQCDDKTAALLALRRAHALKPDDPDYLHGLVNLEHDLQDMPNVERDAASWLSAHPDDALCNYMMAVAESQKPPTPANLQAGLTYAQKALAEKPYYPDAYLLLGQLYLANGQAKDALRAYQAGARLQTRAEPMLQGEVQCYSRLGQMKQASVLAAQLAAVSTLSQHLEHLRSDFIAEPANVDLALTLARVQEQNHLNSDAESTLKNLLRAVPKDPRTHAALAALYRHVGRDDLAQQAAQLNYVPPQEP